MQGIWNTQDSAFMAGMELDGRRAGFSRIRQSDAIDGSSGAAEHRAGLVRMVQDFARLPRTEAEVAAGR